MSHDELMAEVEATLKGAMEDIRRGRESEMRRVLAQIVEASRADGLVPSGEEVMLYLIRQAPITDIDPTKVRLTDDQVGKTIEELAADGYSGGHVTRPFTFGSYSEAVDNMSSPASAVLADYAQGGKQWASISCHKEQGTTVYIMVASNAVTIHKLLPTGDTLVSFHDPDETTGESVEQALYTHGRDIAKAQYQFTAHVQALRDQYPETYNTILSQVLKRLEEEGDDS